LFFTRLALALLVSFADSVAVNAVKLVSSLVGCWQFQVFVVYTVGMGNSGSVVTVIKLLRRLHIV
jgi:hypothetical protein